MPLNLQHTTSRPTRRIILAVLLVVALVLAVLYGREGTAGPLHSIQRSITSVTGNASALTVGVGAALEDAGEGAADMTANPNSLTALREQNEQLRMLLSNADEYRQEAERLEKLLDMKRVSGVEGPTARIIGRSTNPWDQSITIDIGSADGVREGMTVMGATGVIGQVSSAGEHSSVVRLLTDPNSGAAVMIQSSREEGIVRGSLSGVLFLEGLDDDYIPQVGDVVITSGLGGSYQKGYIVGAVVSVNKTLNNPTGTVAVNPNDQASLLEEVIVVFSAPDLASAEQLGGTQGETGENGETGAGAETGQTGEGSSAGEGTQTTTTGAGDTGLNTSVSGVSSPDTISANQGTQ